MCIQKITHWLDVYTFKLLYRTINEGKHLNGGFFSARCKIQSFLVVIGYLFAPKGLYCRQADLIRPLMFCAGSIH